MDFLDVDDPLNFYPDWDPNFDPLMNFGANSFHFNPEWDPNFKPYDFDWETFLYDERFYPNREVYVKKGDSYVKVPEPKKPKESKIYTPFKSLEEVEKVVKELNKDLNK